MCIAYKAIGQSNMHIFSALLSDLVDRLKCLWRVSLVWCSNFSVVQCCAACYFKLAAALSFITVFHVTCHGVTFVNITLQSLRFRNFPTVKYVISFSSFKKNCSAVKPFISQTKKQYSKLLCVQMSNTLDSIYVAD